MANVIQIKRAANNGASSVPSGLASGEMALDQYGRKLYIGRHNNSSVVTAHLPTLDDITAGNGITMGAASSESARGRTLSLTLTDSNIFATTSAKGIAQFHSDNFSVSSGVVTIKNDGVILGTETTGNFVQNLTAGTGVTLSNNSGEATQPTIAIGQAVATNSDVQFAGVTAGNITVGASNDNTITTSSGDLTLNASGGEVIIAGNLQVDGTTTTVNSTVVTVDDPIFRVGGDGNASDDNKDKGMAFAWHNGSAAKVGFFGFDESTAKFTFIPDSSESGSQIMSGTAGNVAFGTITGTSLDGCTVNGGTF
jgi:hypothetical protein|tara:strand:+ start:30 stop:959 length:930 start_codon:yes stop_codon:yes gene_type:complete